LGLERQLIKLKCFAFPIYNVWNFDNDSKLLANSILLNILKIVHL